LHATITFAVVLGLLALTIREQFFLMANSA
jgi:hypothetical protein